MSEYRKHRQRTVAVPDDIWHDFGIAAAALGTDRSKLLVTCMAWYARREGVALPRRPEPRSE